VTTLSDSRLSTLISRHRVGTRVRITFSRRGVQSTVALRTIASPYGRHASMIGVSIGQATTVKLPIEVTIDAGTRRRDHRPGSPSRSKLTDKLGRDIDHGYRVAATGELYLDGSVGAIGGVKQKVIGARRAGNRKSARAGRMGITPRDARRYAGNMTIVQ